jgi:hypothetical protein
MSTEITTDANLLDGVGQFAPVRKQELDSLTPPELNEVGILSFHQAAWRRTVDDLYEQRGIEEDSLTDDAETQLQDVACNMVMHLLYRRASIAMEMDNYEKRAEQHKTEYERLIRKELDLETTTAAMSGESIGVLRS